MGCVSIWELPTRLNTRHQMHDIAQPAVAQLMSLRLSTQYKKADRGTEAYTTAPNIHAQFNAVKQAHIRTSSLLCYNYYNGVPSNTDLTPAKPNTDTNSGTAKSDAYANRLEKGDVLAHLTSFNQASKSSTKRSVLARGVQRYHSYFNRSCLPSAIGEAKIPPSTQGTKLIFPLGSDSLNRYGLTPQQISTKSKDVVQVHYRNWTLKKDRSGISLGVLRPDLFPLVVAGSTATYVDAFSGPQQSLVHAMTREHDSDAPEGVIAVGVSLVSREIVLNCVIKFDKNLLMTNPIKLEMWDIYCIQRMYVLAIYTATIDCFHGVIRFRPQFGKKRDFYGNDSLFNSAIEFSPKLNFQV
ncbi:hypothetical protein F511_38203 [Dorcoceras hygrometricum]|uniref:Uncharacterized protein n=1 Tax=Dorcoceras hygrometricum TaxID=472368 RepID=A0A2Z7A2E0_9LAMI|nr:hypothetical protein F511_38203 [Dorcoceras hygrometricum]